MTRVSDVARVLGCNSRRGVSPVCPAGLVAALVLAGCGEPAAPVPSDRQGAVAPAPRVTRVGAPLDGAHCDVMVDGAGLLDLETEYLPNVVRCENNGANLEALKAQAIAARSVAYYAIETDGSICDSQGCQVYSCGGSADAIHIQAVQETSGMYLKYDDILTYGFYVAGDPNVPAPSCVGIPGGGPTEHFVTYNEGKSGTDVEQTDLGLVSDPQDGIYGQNRGCMSQWGARCLENDNGEDFVGILQFFYGEDIEIVQAQGECVLPVDPPGTDAGGSEGGSDGASASDDGGATSVGGDDADTASDGAADADEDGGGADGGGDGNTALDGASDSGAASGQGTGGEPGALPGTFGDESDGGACACTNGGRAGRLSWLLGIALLALRRARRR